MFSDCSVALIFARLLLSYVAEHSASWQHWALGQFDNLTTYFSIDFVDNLSSIYIP
jgi:hypothetical protein